MTRYGDLGVKQNNHGQAKTYASTDKKEKAEIHARQSCCDALAYCVARAQPMPDAPIGESLDLNRLGYPKAPF